MLRRWLLVLVVLLMPSAAWAREYAIIAAADLARVNFAVLTQTSADTVRCNDAGTLCVIKYEPGSGDISLDDDPILTPGGVYDPADIPAVLEHEDWDGEP